MTAELAMARAEIVRAADRTRPPTPPVAKADLLARLDELTAHGRQRAAVLSAARAEKVVLETRVCELEDELTAARTSLRRMIRDTNHPPLPS